MGKCTEILRKTTFILMLLSGIFATVMVLYFIIFVSKGYYHADCTDTILWAEAVLDGKALMNEDFYYACLLPFGGHLLMVPFVAMFGVSMKAQIIGMSLFTILFIASLVFMAKAMGFTYKWASVIVATVMTTMCMSEKLREIFYTHIIYYSLGLLFLFIGMGMIIRLLKSEKLTLKWMIPLGIWTVLASLNGVQSLAIYGLPALAAMVAELFLDVNTKIISKENMNKIILIIFFGAAVLLGYSLVDVVNGDIVAGYQDGYSGFSAQNKWIENMLSVFPSLFSLLGVTFDGDTMIYTTEGVLVLLRVIFGIMLLVIPVIMLCMYRKFEDIAYRLMILTHTFLTALIMLGWIFGSLNTANWRLSPIVGSSLILCVMFMRWIVRNKKFMRFSAVIAVPMCIVLMTTVGEMKNLEDGTVANKNLETVREFLEENNLEYGYATFWNANSITILSDSKVKVRCIRQKSDGNVAIRIYQTNKNWYSNLSEYEEFFLLLDRGEYNEYINAEGYEEPKKLLKVLDKYILVYDYNIMEGK